MAPHASNDRPEGSWRIADLPSGPAGGSAVAEAARRRANQAARHHRIKQEHPVLGRIALAVSSEPDAGASFARGAVGEQRLGRMLDVLSGKGVVAIHDRCLPGSRANIDHLAITATGVWVIDAKLYKGRVERVRGKLHVRGRDQTKLVDGVDRQVAYVRVALDRAGHRKVPVRGALCFLDAEVGWLQRPFQIGGVSVTWPRALKHLLLEPGPMSPDERIAIRCALARAFRPAVAPTLS